MHASNLFRGQRCSLHHDALLPLLLLLLLLDDGQLGARLIDLDFELIDRAEKLLGATVLGHLTKEHHGLVEAL